MDVLSTALAKPDDMDALLAAAREGLDPVISEGVLHFAASLAAQSVDQALIRREVLRILTMASHIAEARDAVSSVSLESPVLITGFGRTGSTYLHRLMSCDVALRAAHLWELWRPFPAPRPNQRDFRISLAHAQLQHWSREQLQRHPMHAERPDECYWIMPHQHCHALAYNAGAYCAWMAALSDDALCAIYAAYADYVRLLMQHFSSSRWLGKCLAHMHFVPVLHRVFPTAKLIRLHRNPSDAVASYCGLIGAFTKHMLPGRDPFQSRRLVVDVFAAGAGRMMRADQTLACVDVLYDDLVARPVETIATIYGALGLPYSEACHRALIKASTTTPARPSRLALADVGLSRPQVHAAMGDYYAWAEARWGAGIWR